MTAMAGADKEEFPPLLTAGFHQMSVNELQTLCVSRFPDSFTRSGIMRHLDNVITLVNNSAIVGDVWIDGSFLTKKLNPDDVDVLFAIESAVNAALSPQQAAFFDYFRRTSFYPQYRCDNYTLIQNDASPVAQYMFAYWLRQFGFSRKDEMKGIALIKVPFLLSP